jgi:hypothetical protein
VALAVMVAVVAVSVDPAGMAAVDVIAHLAKKAAKKRAQVQVCPILSPRINR